MYNPHGILQKQTKQKTKKAKKEKEVIKNNKKKVMLPY